jgi:hypothetical protein
VVAAIHDEPDTRSDRAEPPDDESIADEIEVIEDVALELLRAVWIIVVGVVTRR